MHPGLSHTAADLTRIKTKALGNEEPWKTAWALFLQYGPTASYTPSPVVNETTGVGEFEIRADSAAAHALALRWYVTGDNSCRDAAINIINAWSYTMQTFDISNNLSAASAARGFGNAGEILIHGNSGWSAADIAQCRSMMLNLLYPSLSETRTAGGQGNQGIDAISGLMAIAIFCDDQAKFDWTVDAYKNHPNCAVTAYIAASGQSGEHGRDQAHASGGLMALDGIARMAFNQGIDLYSWASNRLLAGFEYWCKYNLGHDDVPFSQFGVYTYTTPGTEDRGRFSSMNLESVYAAYITQSGFSSPYLAQAAGRMRPDVGAGYTLPFYTGPTLTVTQLIPAGSLPLVSRLNNLAMGTPNNSATNAVGLDVEAYDGRTSQKWTFTHKGMNIYSLVNHQGKATDVPGYNDNAGTKVQIYTPSGGTNQCWRAIANGDGTLALLNMSSSMGLAITNDYPGSGGLLIQDTPYAEPALGQRWTYGNPSTALPGTPTGLGAHSMDSGEIVVSWPYTTLAFGYNIKRADTATGSYAQLATGLASQTYSDLTAVPSQIYYYVVSGTNGNGTGADSLPVSAICGLPGPWSTTSIGSGATGGSVYDNVRQGFAVSGAGSDIGGSSDKFHYLSQSMTGDGTITARFAELGHVGSDKVGVMMRETIDTGSRMVFIMFDRGSSKSLRIAFRGSTNGGTSYTGSGPSGIDPAIWLRIARAGNVFSAAYSSDGIGWTSLGSATVSMAATIRIGLASCSRSSNENTATFDSVDVPMPGGYQAVDIGMVGTAGHCSYLNGVYTVKGSGGDIGGSSDSLRYLSRPVTGDGTLVARLSSAAYANNLGKIGLMVRESASANARMVFIMLDHGAANALRMAVRSSNGGSTGYPAASASGMTPPRWLKIQRAGNVFTTSYSSNGFDWTPLGSSTVSMASTASFGLAVCSRASGLATATFDNVSLTTP